MRTCGCFGISRMLHVHYARTEETNQTYWSEPHVVAAIQSNSVGTSKRFQQDGLPFESISACEYATVLSKEDHPPVIVLEAIAGAVSIYNFKFPKECEIMVGSENKGVTKEILKNLRRGVDAVVFVPMVGHAAHRSLNVASAMTIALYEYRRQWPSEQQTTTSGFLEKQQV